MQLGIGLDQIFVTLALDGEGAHLIYVHMQTSHACKHAHAHVLEGEQGAHLIYVHMHAHMHMHVAYYACRPRREGAAGRELGGEGGGEGGW